MPSLVGPVAGLECKLYYHLTPAATFTTSGAVLITEAIDVAIALAHTKIDAPSRASNFKSKIPGLTELSLTFKYNYQADPNDAVFTALRTAFLARSILHWAVMDNVLTTPGAKGSAGMTFPGIIYDFPIDQALESPATLDIGVELARLKISSALVDPSWLIVAPS
jgi:hypothetical protein